MLEFITQNNTESTENPNLATINPDQIFSICMERVPYTTAQYNRASYLLKNTPQVLRHGEGYITYLMSQAIEANSQENFSANLARTIIEDILNDENLSIDAMPAQATSSPTLQAITTPQDNSTEPSQKS